jgi:hypothetical protein
VQCTGGTYSASVLPSGSAPTLHPAPRSSVSIWWNAALCRAKQFPGASQPHLRFDVTLTATRQSRVSMIASTFEWVPLISGLTAQRIGVTFAVAVVWLESASLSTGTRLT